MHNDEIGKEMEFHGKTIDESEFSYYDDVKIRNDISHIKGEVTYDLHSNV